MLNGSVAGKTNRMFRGFGPEALDIFIVDDGTRDTAACAVVTGKFDAGFAV